MKQESILRIARLAHANVIDGGASALTLANRITAITGSTDARDIVSQVYSTSSSRSPICQCRECGQEYFGQEAAAACCAEEYEHAA